MMQSARMEGRRWVGGPSGGMEMAADWEAVVMVVVIYESLSWPGTKGCQSVHRARCQWQSSISTVSLGKAVVEDRRGKETKAERYTCARPVPVRK